MNVEKVIAHYLHLRDTVKKELEARHKEELRPIKEDMETIEAALKVHMEKQGVDSLKSKGVGTAYQSVLTSAKVTDREAWLDAIVEREAWDLLEARANKTALIENYEGEFPGVEVSQTVRINVRKN